MGYFIENERTIMGKKEIIDQTIKTLNRLPKSHILQLADYAEFLLKRYEEEILRKGMKQLSSESTSLQFLEEEEELYSLNDLKEKYS
jgi:hypothetical protein